MKDKKLYLESNVGGTELQEQFTAAIEAVKDNIMKHGVYADHEISIKIPFTYNTDHQAWENRCDTTVSVKSKSVAHGPKVPVKVTDKGIFDADPQQMLPIE